MFVYILEGFGTLWKRAGEFEFQFGIEIEYELNLGLKLNMKTSINYFQPLKRKSKNKTHNSFNETNVSFFGKKPVQKMQKIYLSILTISVCKSKNSLTHLQGV